MKKGGYVLWTFLTGRFFAFYMYSNILETRVSFRSVSLDLKDTTPKKLKLKTSPFLIFSLLMQSGQK